MNINLMDNKFFCGDLLSFSFRSTCCYTLLMALKHTSCSTATVSGRAIGIEISDVLCVQGSQNEMK